MSLEDFSPDQRWLEKINMRGGIIKRERRAEVNFPNRIRTLFYCHGHKAIIIPRHP